MGRISLGALLVFVLAACVDPRDSQEYRDLEQELRAVSQARDSLLEVLERLQETPEFFLSSARLSQSDGNPNLAIGNLDELLARFPQSPEAREGQRLRTQIRGIIADSMRNLAETHLATDQLPSARSLAERIQREFGDTPAARGLSGFLATIERRSAALERERADAAHVAAAERARAGAHLEVLSWKWSHSSGYAIAEGQVRNISGSRMENVMAEVTWRAADGTFITSEDALISLNPILPGQTSSFRVMGRWNPAMQSGNLQFKYLMGGAIPTYRPG